MRGEEEEGWRGGIRVRVMSRVRRRGEEEEG